MLFFQASMTFLGHVLSANGISTNPEKFDKIRDWLVPKNAKEFHIHSWVWHLTIAGLSQTLLMWPNAYSNLSVQPMSRRLKVKM